MREKPGQWDACIALLYQMNAVILAGESHDSAKAPGGHEDGAATGPYGGPEFGHTVASSQMCWRPWRRAQRWRRKTFGRRADLYLAEVDAGSGCRCASDLLSSTGLPDYRRPWANPDFLGGSSRLRPRPLAVSLPIEHPSSPVQ